MNLTSSSLSKLLCAAISLLFFTSNSFSQELYPVKLKDGLWHNESRELRYKPDKGDFVITNGDRLFTRALYGTNTAFRIETGDRPEFALYMPGMGGNFKLGIEVNGQSKWLTSVETIETRYRPGSMIYTLKDPLFGDAKLILEVLAMANAEGLIIKSHFKGLKKTVNLISVFGGATGKKFSRDGDMGPDPESNFYLKPEYCKDNRFVITNENFSLKYGALSTKNKETAIEKVLMGTFPSQSEVKIADATALSSPQKLFNSTVIQAPVVTAKIKVTDDQNYYYTVYNAASIKQVYNNLDATKLFSDAEISRKKIADRVKVNTPDPYINTIGATLAIASDAIWEAPTYMHGAIGWRMRLNGWRGAYTADPLGWHDRAEQHLKSYTKSQVLEPQTSSVIADSAMHLARSLEKLGIGMFTSGYISRDPEGKNIRAHHYDMNLVFIDILLRHYAWTGNLDFVKETWPNLKRHLAWEKRNFDPDDDGLFDAYAAIWASDALQYSGGSVTHSSAYNYFAFKKAAEIATLLGEDSSPYSKEADKILKAMNSQLWIAEIGSFAEYKDALGKKLLHPSAALWSVYHSMDSEVFNPFQAYQSMRYIDTQIPHIPIRAKGLNDEGYYTLSTTNWMPYTWSLNNVALAESMHTSLANWQSGRVNEAFKLFKSEILASMYLGGSPGNIVQISHYDATRGEAYRDFGDPVGMFTRTFVEGLFGIVPDALNKSLLIRPGLPTNWKYASLSLPDIDFDFKNSENTDTYILTPKFPVKLKLKFQFVAKRGIKRIKINGKLVSWKNIPSSVALPVVEIVAPAMEQYIITIDWEGNNSLLSIEEKTYPQGNTISENFADATIGKIYDPQQALVKISNTNNSFRANATNIIGKYTVFVQLTKGKLSWWMPVCFSVAKALDLLPLNYTGANKTGFQLKNNSLVDLQVTVKIREFIKLVNIPAQRISAEITLPKELLITGTNLVEIKLPNEQIIKESFVNWNIPNNGTLEKINLNSYFNDKVTQIFKNKYLSPRPQTTTLQLPWQGIGDWPHPLETANIDDAGLRKLAGNENNFNLPQGISFSTPSQATEKNILFTSQWDNYPKESTILLSGKASHAWFLMAGSTNPMQSQLTNGILQINYTDGTADSLVLRNPETWWPIEKDYYTDGYAFSLNSAKPIRIHLKTGLIVSDIEAQNTYNGKEINGGAATVLDLPLDATKTLKSLTLKTIANDVVIGLMSVTLLR